MKYDPKLKEVMAEITGILKKHDLAGYIQLVSPTHCEFRFEITPSWSCAKWEDKDAGKLRFKASSKDLGVDKTEALVEATCHMIYRIRDMCMMGFQNTENMTKLIETQVEVNHTTGEFDPHVDQ